MIRHIVMFSLLDQAEGASKAENALRIKGMLESLRGRIPEIRALEVGINLNHAPGEWDLVLVPNSTTWKPSSATRSIPNT
jgi:hypothetical protein